WAMTMIVPPALESAGGSSLRARLRRAPRAAIPSSPCGRAEREP
ncbi:MAG: hypothetical protein AVDCRST_MAG19-1089, partial [uncultured Thermomicrobiales bacterium]